MRYPASKFSTFNFRSNKIISIFAWFVWVSIFSCLSWDLDRHFLLLKAFVTIYYIYRVYTKAEIPDSFRNGAGIKMSIGAHMANVRWRLCLTIAGLAQHTLWGRERERRRGRDTSFTFPSDFSIQFFIEESAFHLISWCWDLHFYVFFDLFIKFLCPFCGVCVCLYGF